MGRLKNGFFPSDFVFVLFLAKHRSQMNTNGNEKQQRLKQEEHTQHSIIKRTIKMKMINAHRKIIRNEIVGLLALITSQFQDGGKNWNIPIILPFFASIASINLNNFHPRT